MHDATCATHTPAHIALGIYERTAHSTMRAFAVCGMLRILSMPPAEGFNASSDDPLNGERDFLRPPPVLIPIHRSTSGSVNAARAADRP